MSSLKRPSPNNPPKRKRQSTEPNNLDYTEPTQKRQKLTSHHSSSSFQSDSATTKINDNDLFFHTNSNTNHIDNDTSDSDHDIDILNNSNISNISSNTYKTPLITKKLFTSPLHTTTTNITNNSSLLCISPYINTPNNNRNNDIQSPICITSENALSIIYKYLSFNDILSMSKINIYFWNLSFKLISSLTI
eukprot:111611_1